MGAPVNRRQEISERPEMRIRIRWATVAALIAGAILAYGMMTWAVTVADEPGGHLPPCSTEDSDDCRWDADRQGNGAGRSFTVVDGVVTYTEESAQ